MPLSSRVALATMIAGALLAAVGCGTGPSPVPPARASDVEVRQRASPESSAANRQPGGDAPAGTRRAEPHPDADASIPRDRPQAPPDGRGDARKEDRSAAAPGTAFAARASRSSASHNGAIRECTFDDIKFEMAEEESFERSMLTPAIEALDGSRIRIRGYILPSFQQQGLTEFVLVRDNMECCFGPGAALYDCIVVKMAEGKSTDFSIRPVAVTGVFSIQELVGPDGKHLAIYQIDGEAVQ